MSTALTPGQHALLEAELLAARQRVEQALRAQPRGSARVAPAAELLAVDPQDWRERELEPIRSDLLLAELSDICDALMRLKLPGYGRCIDCAAAIPFERLQRRPQALRCLDCQRAAETAH